MSSQEDVAQALREEGLTIMQFAILRAVSELNDGEGASVTEITKFMNEASDEWKDETELHYSTYLEREGFIS